MSTTATVAPIVPATAIPPPPTEQPVALVTPSAFPTVAQAYALADLIGDLVAVGLGLAPAPGRIVKPYLSANGVVLNVDGQPVQVFEYLDEATLKNDVAGLVPDGSSIDGTALTWQIPPRLLGGAGTVLVLALTEDTALVERLSQSLGTPIAAPEQALQQTCPVRPLGQTSEVAGKPRRSE